MDRSLVKCLNQLFMNEKVKGNIAMGISKILSGLNENALKFLVPRWMSPFSGVVLRLVFGSAAFWVSGLIARKSQKQATVKQKLSLFVMGAILIFGYMFFLLAGLKYTTPVTSSIFISLQPAIVFIISAFFLGEKVTKMKIIGIALGIAGATVCVTTQHTSSVSSDPTLGAFLCFCSALSYSLFLIFSKKFLLTLDDITVSKWSFTGGAFSALIATIFVGWDAPVLAQSIFSTPMLVLLFVLIFPTFISYFLVDTGLKTLATTVVALYSNLILVVAAIVSYILGQDIFSWWQLLAIALIICSVYFTEKAENKSNI